MEVLPRCHYLKPHVFGTEKKNSALAAAYAAQVVITTHTPHDRIIFDVACNSDFSCRHHHMIFHARLTIDPALGIVDETSIERCTEKSERAASLACKARQYGLDRDDDSHLEDPASIPPVRNDPYRTPDQRPVVARTRVAPQTRGSGRVAVERMIAEKEDLRTTTKQLSELTKQMKLIAGAVSMRMFVPCPVL